MRALEVADEGISDDVRGSSDNVDIDVLVRLVNVLLGKLKEDVGVKSVVVVESVVVVVAVVVVVVVSVVVVGVLVSVVVVGVVVSVVVVGVKVELSVVVGDGVKGVY